MHPPTPDGGVLAVEAWASRLGGSSEAAGTALEFLLASGKLL